MLAENPAFERHHRIGDLARLWGLDSGMAVGVSSHMPAVFDTIESRGWDVDYYQTCLYERIRTTAELEALLG